MFDDESEGIIVPVTKKVDLRYAISSLSAGMGGGRKAPEELDILQLTVYLVPSLQVPPHPQICISVCTFF